MTSFLHTAERAARAAGAFLAEHYEQDLVVDEMLEHDIKIELDRRTQALITDILLGDHPDHAIIGEEGNAGDEKSDHRWIVDPIDGTVNYFFGIPHFCVSIALREGEKTLLGVVYDPMRDELFSTTWDSEPTRNESRIQVSSRATLSEAIITVGFSKTNEGLEEGVDRYKRISRQVRKTRMLGSAALGMAYIACGRLDAYLEESVSDWDIAAGELLIQRAGGTVLRDQKPNSDKIRVCSSNGKLPLQEIWS